MKTQSAQNSVDEWRKNWLNHPDRITYERTLKQILHYKPKWCRNQGRPWKRWNECIKLEQGWVPIPVIPKLVGMTEVVHTESMGVLQNWSTKWQNYHYTYLYKCIKAVHWALLMQVRCLKIGSLWITCCTWLFYMKLTLAHRYWIILWLVVV